MQFDLIKRPVIFGVLAGFFLILFYFLILTLTQSFFHATEQFFDLWYLITPLVLGFSLQVFLFSFIKEQIKENKLKAAGGEVAASGGVSTVSMIACCSHHLTDVAPLLGLSALFVFLANYQIFFLLLGISSNIFGIIMMLGIIKKMNLGQEHQFFRISNQWNWGKIKIIASVILAIALLASFFIVKNKQNIISNGNSSQTINLSARENSASGLDVEVEPIDFSFSKPVQLKITFDTHQGALDFDLTKISYIMDEKGKKYFPERWEGGSGGHHLAGTLYFSGPIKDTKTIEFIIENVYNTETRKFLWQL